MPHLEVQIEIAGVFGPPVLTYIAPDGNKLDFARLTSDADDIESVGGTDVAWRFAEALLRRVQAENAKLEEATDG